MQKQSVLQFFFSTRVQAKHKMHFCAMLGDSRMREHYGEWEASNFFKNIWRRCVTMKVKKHILEMFWVNQKQNGLVSFFWSRPKFIIDSVSNFKVMLYFRLSNNSIVIPKPDIFWISKQMDLETVLIFAQCSKSS